MPVPQVPNARAAAITSVPASRPEVASTIQAPVRPPFRLRIDPRQIDLFDLSKAPEAALKKAGIQAGFYWLPVPYEMPAVPGVNGVWMDVAAGWTTDDMLAKGFPELTSDDRAAGVVLLDAWAKIPGEFCPDGQPSTILQYTPVRGGRYYHSVWGGLRVTDPRQPAMPIHDSALQACWVASMVRAGEFLPALETVVADKISLKERRVGQLLANPAVTEDSALLRQERALLEVLRSAERVTRAD